ncbi:ATP-binding protein [Actinokineospora cianjurensis]|uniref:ATP-binding protein n=1 Tax=Actinokineospora cianjurensis TaxID=585224 RepID=UPI001B86E6BD|nr:tetratricopeptide repeat protein [Actinokineospora cianjurensis]
MSGGIHFHHAKAEIEHPVARRPRQLPADISTFINRAKEMRLMDKLAAEQLGRPNAGAVHVITGMAGVGKTALAIRQAHRLAPRFPDGQLYINLRGYDPGIPINALVALSRFLVELGVPVAAVPGDTDTAAATYRSLVADRAILIVLDNAASVAQVRPLIPGGANCVTLITSRNQLSSLTIHEGARRITIGTLTERDSVTLLRKTTAGYRTEDPPHKVAELARLCARLPLALRIAAERAVSHPHTSIDELIEGLRGESSLWDMLSVGDEGEEESVEPVFSWSYRALSADSARLFRLLGVHPSYDLSINSIAALSETPVRRTRQLLDSLVAAHMIEQIVPGRYEVHDLLRAYALDKANVDETPGSREKALVRVLDWHLHTAGAARERLTPAYGHVPLEDHGGEITPQLFADYDSAADWAEAEDANLPALVAAAVKAGLDGHAWRLALLAANARAPSAPATTWPAVGLAGVAAARRTGDRMGEADLYRALGYAHVELNQLDESLVNHGKSVELYRTLNDPEGLAESLNALGVANMRWRKLAVAARCFQEAKEIVDRGGSLDWQNLLVVNIASVHLEAGRLDEARRGMEQSLRFNRAVGNTRDIGHALRQLSAIHLDQGAAATALRLAKEAVDLALDLRNHMVEGYWLLAVADAHTALGQFDDALTAYQRSAALHRRLGDRGREARAWHGTGVIYQLLGRTEEAADFHRTAAKTQHELGHAWYEAIARDSLATALADRNPAQSLDQLRSAHELLRAFDDPRARALRDTVEAKLREIHDPR